MACIRVRTILLRTAPALPLRMAIQEMIVGSHPMGSRNRGGRELKMMPNHSLERTRPARAFGSIIVLPGRSAQPLYAARRWINSSMFSSRDLSTEAAIALNHSSAREAKGVAAWPVPWMLVGAPACVHSQPNGLNRKPGLPSDRQPD